ncbi:hypothetical protein BC829DRAFT_224823 [Chytridium lagenaria]|nr:hypothetical protein BC829DRAFT_224823 [Chytridium lagenaria]
MDPPFLDYYALLQISHRSTTDEIRKAFKKLALKHHPDKAKQEKNNAASTSTSSSSSTKRSYNSIDPAAVFIQLREAVDCLTDSSKRSHYDNEWKKKRRHDRASFTQQSSDTVFEEWKITPEDEERRKRRKRDKEELEMKEKDAIDLERKQKDDDKKEKERKRRVEELKDEGKRRLSEMELRMEEMLQKAYTKKDEGMRVFHGWQSPEISAPASASRDQSFFPFNNYYQHVPAPTTATTTTTTTAFLSESRPPVLKEDYEMEILRRMREKKKSQSK